jgi:hypothetical protein
MAFAPTWSRSPSGSTLRQVQGGHPHHTCGDGQGQRWSDYAIQAAVFSGAGLAQMDWELTSRLPTYGASHHFA